VTGLPGAMAFSMLFYDLSAFVITLYARSPFHGYFALVVFHWMFYKAAFGLGPLSNLEYDLYYPLAFTVWTLAGVVFNWTFKHCSLLSRVLNKSKVTGNVAEYAVRMYASLLLLLCVALPYELIPHFSGGIVSLTLAPVACICGHFLISKFRVFQADEGGFGQSPQPPKDLSMAFFMYVFGVFFVSVIVFWLLTDFTAFWQFYTSLILGGVCLLFFVAARFLWMTPKSRAPAYDAVR